MVTKSYYFVGLNEYLYDYFLYVNRSIEPQKQIVIVEIDNKSLLKLGKWPLDRKYYAQLLDILFKDKARVVAFYLYFYDYTNNESDKSFIKRLKEYPTVLLDSGISPEYSINKTFWQEISKTSILAHNVFPVDKNNIVRNQFLFISNKPSFPLAILHLTDKQKYDQYKNYNLKAEKASNIILINYKRTASKFEEYSLVDVLEGKIPSTTFKNKIVMVAPSAKGLTNYYLTPFTRHQGAFLSGLEKAIIIQAQILDSLMNYGILKTINPTILSGFIFIFLFLLLNILFQMGIFRQLILSFIILPPLILLTSLILLEKATIWITPLPFLLACLLGFLIVSISVVTTTTRFIDKYINELSNKSKSKVALKLETSVDSKLLSLLELTDIINADRDILETVLTSVSSIIMLFDKNGTIIYSNHPDYYKVNFNICDISQDIDLDEIKKTSSQNETYKKKIELKQSYYNFIVNPAKGNYYVGILNDITDMVKINEMKSDMLRMLSHEFKTPLATILLCSDYVSQTHTDQSIGEYLERINNQTEFLEEMIDNFLALNKLEVSDFQINKESTNIVEFVKPIIDNLRVIAENKKINIQYIYDESTPVKAPLDKKYMLIAIKNLIDNAMKYSPANTTIIIKLTKSSNNIKLSIKDEGFGISKDNLNKLFEKFYRVKTDKTKVIKGTGLGLSFVKRIIELHGGKIDVKSQENHGSEFIILLPIENS